MAKDDKDAQAWIRAVQVQVSKISKDQKINEYKMANHSLREGFLRKRGGNFKRWKTRYFVLLPNGLQWFENKTGQTKKGGVQIWKDTEVGMVDGEQCVFRFKPTAISKEYMLMAKDTNEAMAWVNAIKAQAALLPPYAG